MNRSLLAPPPSPRRRLIIEVALIFIIAGAFVLPQIQQQFLRDRLPATGDMIHKRLAYLVTNYPNFYSPGLLQEASHSKFYHYTVGIYDIFTGLTGDRTFAGFAALNLMMLPLAALILYVIARRLEPRFALVAPLIFYANAQLVFPFFGQANQHLSFMFFALFLYVHLMLPSSWWTRAASVLLLGVALNGSLVIWSTIILTLFVSEWFYPERRAFALGASAVVLYLPILLYPLSYLLGVGPKLVVLIIGLSLIILAAMYAIERRWPVTRKPLLVLGMVALLVPFMIQQPQSPLYQSLRDVEQGKQSFQSETYFGNLFSINEQKPTPGDAVYFPLLIVIGALSAAGWYVRRRGHPDSRLVKTLFFVSAAIIGVTTLRYLLLRANFEYFIRSPMGSFHVGRINSLAFFIIPVLSAPFLVMLRHRRSALVAGALGLAVIVNLIVVSNFFYNRVYPDWTQRSYQREFQRQLFEGDQDSLSPVEAQYSCKFYHHCDLKVRSDIGF